MSQQEASLSSLPLELLQIITTYIDDLDTLIAWNQTFFKSRQASAGRIGEQKFQELFRDEVPYWNSALIAARVQFLDLQDGWTQEVGKPWTFKGKEINQEWFHDLLTWPAKTVYDVFLSHPGNEGFVPWAFEYCVLQANQKFPISFLASREEDGVLCCNPPFDNIWGYMSEAEYYVDAYFAAFYWLRTWTLLFAHKISETLPALSEQLWPYIREYETAYFKTRDSWSPFIAYVCSTATEKRHQSKRDEEVLFLGHMWTAIDVLDDRVQTYVRDTEKAPALPWSTYQQRRKSQLDTLLSQRCCSQEAMFFFYRPLVARRAPINGHVFRDAAELIVQQGEKGRESLRIAAIARNEDDGKEVIGSWWHAFIERYLAEKFGMELVDTMTTGWEDFAIDGGFLSKDAIEMFIEPIDRPDDMAEE